MPGHSLIGSVATLESSSVTCPENPGSIQPAVECVSRPSRPRELLPSSRPAMSSGSETTSKVDPSTNSPGCRTNGSSSSVSTSRVDVRVAVILEDPEVPVQPDVDAGRLDQLRRVRIELDPARLDLSLDVAIREEHPGNLSGPVRCLSEHSTSRGSARQVQGRAGVVQWQNISFPS